MKRNRKGFTLIELLIVIVVIGILSAMMMLSSTEAVSSAKASNIVSNLRNLKTAALAYYVDDLDNWSGAKSDRTFEMSKVVAYLGNNSGMTSNGAAVTDSDGTVYTLYSPNIAAADSQWYIYATVIDTNVQKKLVGRAKSIGLLNAGQFKDKPSDNGYYDAKDKNVYMFVR